MSDPIPQPEPPESLVQGSIQRGIDDATAGRARRASRVIGEQLALFEIGEEEA